MTQPNVHMMQSDVPGRYDLYVNGDTVGYLERGLDDDWQLWIKAAKGHQLAGEGMTRLKVVNDWMARNA